MSGNRRLINGGFPLNTIRVRHEQNAHNDFLHSLRNSVYKTTTVTRMKRTKGIMIRRIPLTVLIAIATARRKINLSTVPPDIFHFDFDAYVFRTFTPSYLACLDVSDLFYNTAQDRMICSFYALSNSKKVGFN